MQETSETPGPCVYFKKQDTCGNAPGLNPVSGKYQDSKKGLPMFAHDWMEYTCCKILTEPLAGIISSVWLWSQVCTKAVIKANSDSEYTRYDLEYAAEKFPNGQDAPYSKGPLQSMKQYCPQDLDGGDLSEWVVATFFPVNSCGCVAWCSCFV